MERSGGASAGFRRRVSLGSHARQRRGESRGKKREKIRLSMGLSRSGREEKQGEENKANFLLQSERQPEREAHDQ